MTMHEGQSESSRANLFVESIEPGSSAERAGLEVGVWLLTYQGHPLVSPATLSALEENTVGVECATLWVGGEGQRQEHGVVPGKLGVVVRPDLGSDALTAYESGREALHAGQAAEAARCWSEAAQQVRDHSDAVWLWLKAGEAWESVSEWRAALSAYTSASERLGEAEDTATKAVIRAAQGRCHQGLHDFAAAEDCYEQARQTNERDGHWIWVAQSLMGQAVAARARGDLDVAHQRCAAALKLCEHYAPDSLHEATSSFRLGVVTYWQGNLAQAQAHLVRALNLQEQLAPDSDPIAATFNTLGIVAADSGNLASAQDYFERSLEIRERHDPDSLGVAEIHNNLGGIALYRHDLPRAQDYFTRSLQIRERHSPDSLVVADSHNNLGLVALERGELDAAQKLFLLALDICERRAPGSPDAAVKLYNLGEVALQRGDLEVAQGYYERTMPIRERQEPLSINLADSLERLGSIALRRNRPEQAIVHLQRSIEIIEQLRAEFTAPEIRASLLAQHMRKYGNLIQSFMAQGEVASAFATLERSRARSLLELLADRNLDLSADAPPDLLQQQRELDRQRAAVYEQLADANLSSASDAESDGAEATTLHRSLRELERRKVELVARIRIASPRYAALQYPQSLDLAAVRAVLEPGTLLLSYFVDEEQTYLFAITANANDILVRPLPIGRAALQLRVREFRRALHPRSGRDAQEAVTQGRDLYTQLIEPANALVRRAKRLLVCPDGPLHILPFGALVTNSARPPCYLGAVVPIHSTLSMTLYAQTRAQQPSPTTQARRRQAHRKAVTHAATDPLNDAAPFSPPGSQRDRTPRRLFAVGDPLYVYPGAAPVNAEIGDMQTRGLALRPLPHTRAEVENLQELYGEAATVRLGVEATKTAVLQESGQADILHLACHGWIDPYVPLSSALVLSLPEALGERALEGDNGLLQAWEVFQKLRLDADLVVLSACRTGMGLELPGEGLLGLTRAFQYAGARSLVVSLWEIDDASTSRFMAAFYAALQAGICKAEALQAAIRVLQAHPTWKHPYYWSAFVLIGDAD